MKAKLIINIDDDFTKEDAVRALHANDAYSAIEDIRLLFREGRKWGTLNGKEITEQELELLDIVYEKIAEIISDLPCEI